MKKILLVIFTTFIYIGLSAQGNIYQTDSYKGFKAFKELFVKDSLLFYFSNGHMSGCVVTIMKYDHTSKGLDYYRPEKKYYSLLSGAMKTGRIASDSMLFSLQGFCKYEKFFSEKLTVNGKAFEIDSNGICKVSKRDVLDDTNRQIVNIEFNYLGKYSDRVVLKNNDNLVLIFFHLNSSGTLRDINSVDLVSIKSSKDDSGKYFTIGRHMELFKRVDFSESGFSQVLLEFLNIVKDKNSDMR